MLTGTRRQYVCEVRQWNDGERKENITVTCHPKNEKKKKGKNISCQREFLLVMTKSIRIFTHAK